MAIESSEAQLLIDEKIKYHVDCIKQLKSKRNELSPISKLSPDILITIFHLLSASQSEYSRPLPCYSFTHVSRSWRNIALDTPTLWQVLPTISTQWATAFFERSKAADLTVGLHPFPHAVSRTSFMKHLLNNHASRIRHLDLFDYSPRFLASLFENIQPSSLRFHSLSLTSDGSRDFTFPSGLLDTSSLQTLKVNRCCGPWYSLSFPALTTLTLIDIPNPLCLPKFLDMLRALRALAYLTMKNSFPLADNSVSGSCDLVRLPNLHGLNLCSTIKGWELSNLLSSIVIPQTATLGIIVANPVDTSMLDVIFGEFTSSLWKTWPTEHGTFYSDLYISSLEEYSLNLQAWKDCGCSSGQPDLNLGLGPEGLQTSQDMIQKVFRLFPPLFNITTLTLWLHIPLDSLMQNTLGRLPYLHTINLRCKDFAAAIHALMYQPENYNIDSFAYYSVTFPALRSLSFSLCVEVEELVDCLIERCERRAELWNLKLLGCGLCAEDVERLREIVVDVEWGESYD